MIAEPDTIRGPARPARVVRRYHFHTPGILYIGVTLFLAVGAINSQNNLLFAALGLAIGGLLVSGLLSGASLMGITVERLPSERLAVGRPGAIRYAVVNNNRLVPGFGLYIEELEQDSAGNEGSWPRFFHRPLAFVAHVGPRKTVFADAAVTPSRRGVAGLAAVRVWSTFPFGLAKKSMTFDLDGSVLVHPVDLPIRKSLLERLTARAPTGRGAERTPGSGDEFFGLREYTQGDNPRGIAWKRTARTGEVVVRQHSSPVPMRLWIVLFVDRPFAANQREGGEAGGARFEAALALAASLARRVHASGVEVGFAVAGSDVLIHPALGARQGARILDAMTMLDSGSIRPDGGVPVAATRSGVCIIVATGAEAASAPARAIQLSAGGVKDLVEPGDAGINALRRLEASSDKEPASLGRRMMEAGLRFWSGSSAA